MTKWIPQKQQIIPLQKEENADTPADTDSTNTYYDTANDTVSQDDTNYANLVGSVLKLGDASDKSNGKKLQAVEQIVKKLKRSSSSKKKKKRNEKTDNTK